MLIEKPTGEIRTAYDRDNEPYLFEATGKEAKHFCDMLRAEDDGRLVILPCKVGDTVYKLWYEPCHFGNAHPDGIDCDGCEDACDIKQAVVECKATNIEWIIHNMMCKQPFAYANREEAEAALKRGE